MTVQVEKPSTPAARVSKQTPKAGAAGAKPGLGATPDVTVKGRRATSVQRAVINGTLGVAQDEGASRRVMVAVIMCITQESACSTGAVNGDHVGPFQQSPAWGTVSQRKDATSSCRLFLTGGHSAGTPGWKQTFGSVQNAPGDLAAGVEKVQRSGRPSLYAQWQTEASNTVDAFLGDTGGLGEQSGGEEPYEFARGGQGQTEDSWACTGRLAEEVGWSRWAEINTLFYVSDAELRAGAPALEIHGDEPWLLSPPGWEWSPNRALNNVTLNVLADRWGVQVGAVVLINQGSPADGRYLVKETHGHMVDPTLQVVLERPAPRKAEPAANTSSGSGDLTAQSGGSYTLLDACRAISNQDHPYVLGGGHGKPLGQISAREGLDCSSSVCLALYKAGLFASNTAVVSSELAVSWGSPGKGREYTIWASPTHCWIEFAGVPGVNRFDTVPYGDGPSGPHLRRTARSDQSRFTARH